MSVRQEMPQDEFVSGKVLRKLLQQQPTPFYLYDAEKLRDACRRLQQAFSWNEGFAVCFPVRMNPNPAVLHVLKDAGCRFLCASEAELRLARLAQAEGADMIYAPFVLDEHAAAYAGRIGAAQLTDGPHAIPPQPPEHVFLSVNPGGRLQMGGRTVWNFEKSKLGMPVEELLPMCRRFQAGGAKSIGLTVFLRDQELDTARFLAAQQMLLRLSVRLYEEHGLRADSLMICGGLGAGYRAADKAPELSEISARVKNDYEEILHSTGLRPRLILAEGRLLAAQAGVLVTRVQAVKEQPSPLVVLDADCAQFLREIAFGANHPLTAPLVPQSRAMRMVRVAGSLCDLRDHFAASCVLPELKFGECVLICGAGADGRSFASNYGGSLGCAEFLLDSGEIRCIRKRQSMQQLLDSFSAD